jgi:hypothetical protein
MNTGDAAGDVFFGLYELGIPVLCSDAQMKKMVTCANVPILSIPGFNVYQQFVLEVDTRFGEYNECNPDPDTGVFACVARHFSRGGWAARGQTVHSCRPLRSPPFVVAFKQWESPAETEQAATQRAKRLNRPLFLPPSVAC